MTDKQELQDELLNDATHAAADEFERGGIKLTSDELDLVNDVLTDILADRAPQPNRSPTYAELVGALQWMLDGLSDDYGSHIDDDGARHDYIENAARMLAKAGGSVADKRLLENNT